MSGSTTTSIPGHGGGELAFQVDVGVVGDAEVHFVDAAAGVVGLTGSELRCTSPRRTMPRNGGPTPFAGECPEVTSQQER